MSFSVEYNNDPSNYIPIPSDAVLSWMGENARFYKIKQFISSTEQSTDEMVVFLRSALETVLIAINNPNTKVDIYPGSKHMQVVSGLVAMSVLNETDLNGLVEKAMTPEFYPATAADVEEVILEIEKQDRESGLVKIYDRARNAIPYLVDPLNIEDVRAEWIAAFDNSNTLGDKIDR